LQVGWVVQLPPSTAPRLPHASCELVRVGPLRRGHLFMLTNVSKKVRGELLAEMH
jgi:hypothetical protein